MCILPYSKHILYGVIFLKSRILRFQGLGLISTVIMGPILHFLYDWTNGSFFAALVSGVNESTWEHMKLLFVPMFIFAIVESFFVADDVKDYWCVKLKGILLGLLSIPVLFYTYKGVLGKNIDWINISIFFISAVLAYFIETRLFLNEKKCRISQKTAVAVLVIIAVMFAVFTFSPPEIDLFADPLVQ